MNKKNVDKILNILIIILIILLSYMFIDSKNDSQVKEDNSKIYDLNYYKDYYLNEDIIGSLKIKDTKIDTLLVKSNNNEYYLNHSINKEYDIKGSIFVDYRTNLKSKQINIYGHNSKEYDLPFKELEKYKEKAFYDSHKIIEIWNGKEVINYEIFSVQIVENNSEHMNINKVDEKHIEKLSNSIYNTGVVASTVDQILVLQTCNYNPKNTYLLVMAKRVNY